MSRISRILVIAILLCSALLFGEEKRLTVIHTNDLHSHLLGFSPNIDYTPLRTGDDQNAGGWARIAAVIILFLGSGVFLFSRKIRKKS